MGGSARVRELWNRLLETLETGDASAWASALAEDAVVIGTDAAEWWEGRDAALSVIEVQVRELRDAGVRYGGSDPQVTEVGDVLWIADRPHVVLADGTVMPTRLTAVLTRDGDSMLIRQLHMSIGASNEEALQQQLTV
jgi:ketosteroid isomerase-like protein